MTSSAHHNRLASSPGASSRWRPFFVPCLLTACLLAAGVWIGEWRVARQDAANRQSLRLQTMAIASTLDPDSIRQLNYSPEDRGTPAFERLSSHLRTFARSAGLRSVFTMALRDEVIVFGPESLEPEDPLASPPGTVYQEPSDADWSTLLHGTVEIEGPYTDEYGVFVGATAPVIDGKTGQALLALGIDVPAEDWQRQVASRRHLPWLGACVLIILVWAGFVRLVLRWPSLPLSLPDRHVAILVVGSAGTIASIWAGLLAYEAENLGRFQRFQQLAIAYHNPLVEKWTEWDRSLKLLAVACSGHEISDSHFQTQAAPLLTSGGMAEVAWIPASEKQPVLSAYSSEPRLGGAVLRPSGAVPAPLLQQAAHNRFMVCASPAGNGNEMVSYALLALAAFDQSGQLQGYIVARVHFQDFFDDTFSFLREESSRLAFRLSDLSNLSGETLLASSGVAPGTPSRAVAAYARALGPLPLFAFGRTYALEIEPSPAFLAANSLLSGWLSGIAGLLATAMACTLIRVYRKRQFILEDQVQQLTRAVEQSPAQIVITDTKGSIIYVNPKFTEVTGYSATEAFGKNPRILKSNHHGPDFYRNLWRTILQGNEWHGEMLNRRKNGTEFWERASVSPVRDPGGKITHFVAVKEDITEEKKTADALLMALDQAQSATRAKSQFLANMSHEIRTPMNGIIGMTGLLLDTPLSSEQRDYAETVRSSADTLLQLINHILDFSKIESGKMELEKADFNLRETVEDAASLLAVQAQDKGLELSVILDPSIPIALRGDSGRLRQILINLLGNAVKFTAKGEIILRVRLHEKKTDSLTLGFEVEDTGPGIPADQRNRLFQPFSQIDASTTRKFGGTGLGLVISRQLATLLQGEIGVESAEGKGSTFWFSATFERQPHAPEFSGPPSKEPSVRALVASSLASCRQSWSFGLQLCGISPSPATELRSVPTLLHEAFEAENPFELVLLDYSDSCRKEFESLLSALRSDPRLAFTKRIVLCPMDLAAKEQSRHMWGCDACLAKPLRTSNLIDCLARLLPGSPRPATAAPDNTAALPKADLSAHVLLVEDNIINQKVAGIVLERLGCTYEIANDGVEAISALSSKSYDLILMDCQMPGLDGYATTAAIRKGEAGKNKTEIPIIALTANAMPGDEEKCLKAGMNAYLSKPIKVDLMAETLRYWLEISRSFHPS